MVNAQVDSATHPVLNTLRNVAEVVMTTAAIALIAHVSAAGAVEEASRGVEVAPLSGWLEVDGLR